jgi:hypothetical protein
VGCYSGARMKHHLAIYFSFISCLFFLFISSAHAEVDYEDIFDDAKEMEKQQKSWTEVDFEIPSYPEEKNLLRVPLPKSNNVNIYIDQKSLSYDKDGVTRYTIVIETSTGYRNVFYEGLRCSKTNYKVYAFGNAEKTFVRMKSAKWQDIKIQYANNYRHYLFKHFFCTPYETPRETSDIIRAITLPAEED